MKKIFLCLLIPVSVIGQKPSPSDITRWQQQANRITIIRDNWGIPHIYAKTDADCVFGLLYAQCEDDFKRVEGNYIDILGRNAEIKGESALYNDLYTKLVIDSAEAVADYLKSPDWLKKLLQAWADGINYYLYMHAEVKPALLTRFQPWYPLMWTDGSINPIKTEDLDADDVKSFYSGSSKPVAAVQHDMPLDNGSNGFAIGPSKSASGNAMLYINPHVTFYFRPEVQVTSEEGLNAYGAVTWGQFFVYQGFNEHCGWMHTSGYTDVADVYLEKITKKGDSLFYEYEKSFRPVRQQEILLKYRDGNSIQTKKITAYYTHHGPVMGTRRGQWVTVRAVNRSLNALIQSWNRTKSKGFDDFRKNMELLSNGSNNTVFADDKGNIAYWHGNFVPKRDKAFDWSLPVDGSVKSTEWQGLHKLDEIIHVYNPATGWIQNCNSTPYTSSGTSSPKKEDYPFYMATEPENFRAVNAAKLLTKADAMTIDKLIATGYDSYLAAFRELVPALVNAFETTVKKEDSIYNVILEPVTTLKNWNLYSSASSVATTLGVEWIQRLQPRISRIAINDKYAGFVEKTAAYPKQVQPAELIQYLATTVNDLRARFGTWQIPWGDLNRYQRLTGELQQTYDDSKPSIPSGMASSAWGCIPSFVSRYFPGTKKRYGYNGNSFICAVEFGKRIKAKSLLTGGESSNPASPHFNDQAEMYTKGQFKDVLFYKEDVLKHVEKTYHPGE